MKFNHITYFGSIFSRILLAISLPLVIVTTTTMALADQTAPVLSVKGLDNADINIGDFKGKVLYVDFWATWCPPCRKSFPWMEEMHQRYNDLGFEILAISLDNKRSVIDKFLKSVPTNFIIAHDAKGGSAQAFNVKGMPSSYLIDRKGNIRLSHMGFNSKDKIKLEAEIKALIAED
ncbi:MAG: TlpA family protein disulfide reductase [Gammaproteobacteria bacterium]|nr:TlpA family protein disulfide reductase [Gammaproteobacteria bacterium]